MTAQEAVSGLCCQRYFELSLTLGGRTTDFLYRLAPFENKSLFGDLLISSPPLVTVTQAHSCCLVLGLCSTAVFQLQERQRPLLPKHFVVPCLINWARSDLPFTALPEIDCWLRNPKNVLILWI